MESTTPAFGKLKQEDPEFKANLGSVVSSRSARVIEADPSLNAQTGKPGGDGTDAENLPQAQESLYNTVKVRRGNSRAVMAHVFNPST